MGVKGLPGLIKKIAGNYAIRSYKLAKFKGKGWVVPVDASFMIHQTVIAIRSTGRDLTNCQGDITSHIHGIFYKILVFLENGIIPVFVFDGKPPELKKETIDKRRKITEEAEKKLCELSDEEDEEYVKNFKRTYRVTSNDIKQIQILLDLMGVPYINAPGEADPVCAWLTSRKDANGRRFCKGVCSDDSDMLVYGAPYLFRGMSRFLSKNKPVEIISLDKTLERMDFSMDQFVDMCVLIGTDNCDNFRGIGPDRAYKLIKANKTLDQALKVIKKKVDSDDPDAVEEYKTKAERMKLTRNHFQQALLEIDELDNFVITDEQLELRKFQHAELMDFMCIKHGFDMDRTASAINRLKEYHEILGVERPNTSKVHTISQSNLEYYKPNSSHLDDIECLSDSEESTISEISEPVSRKTVHRTRS